MVKSYVKRIWVQKSTSVYVVVKDSKPVAYRVLQDRRIRAEVQSKDAAYQLAQQLLNEIPVLKYSDASFLEAAKLFVPTEVYKSSLEPRFLAALEVLRLSNDDRHQCRQDVALMVGALASEAGCVPMRTQNVEAWVSEVFRSITRPVSRSINSKSTIKTRVQTFLRLLAHIENSPTAFKGWLDVVSIAKVRLKILERGASKEKDTEESFEAYCKSDIEKMMAAEKFNDVCRCLVYLSGAFRSGEGDNFSTKHLVGDRVNLPKLVTKVKTKRLPMAPLVLQVLARFLDHQPSEVPEWVVKKRLRPTAAVHLLLSGVPGLEVMERMGHANLSMIVNHYAKMTPEGWGPNYFGINNLTVDGITIEANAYDRWLLFLLLREAKRRGILSIKPLLLTHLMPSVVQMVASDF